MKITTFAAAAALAAVWVAPALAQDMVSANDPDAVVAAMTELGFRPELTLGNAETPTQIVVPVAGSNSVVTFYGCNESRANCSALLFAKGKDLSSGATMSRVNEWNYSEVYGRTYLDNEDDPWVDMMVITGAGMPAELFGVTVRRWESVVGKFDAAFK
jgi:hypothetical protein